ncbi:MAG: ATP-binding protein, partial [Nostoc sp.]|uniref:sensor histidine kinase n=1 Tax=Nostoc sp. TaxID=1180 RepID=UPI002FFBCB4B
VIKEYGQLPLVNCYVGALNQVFMNILSNAIDALEMGTSNWGITCETFSLPTIRIRTEIPHPDRVLIRIADNGLGMSESTLKRIFNPFFTTKPVGSGTGLGLSISYSIVVKQHGGHLTCSSAPGKGTEFVIDIFI